MCPNQPYSKVGIVKNIISGNYYFFLSGGEGLFAKAALPKGHIIAFYNGVRLNTSSLLLEYRYGESDYRIRLNAEVDLDIPKGSESLSAYKATLGHKVNHSFENNAEWLLVEHPRFGLIRGLRAAMPIEKVDSMQNTGSHSVNESLAS